MASRRAQGPPVGAYPREAILAMAEYRECIETWQEIAASKRPKDERKMAVYYLAVAFDVDYETLVRPS